MTQHGGPLLRVTRTRPVRALSALILIFAIAGSGLAFSITPARAATPAPSLTSPSPSTDNDATPTWSFGDAVAAYECSFGPVPNAPSYVGCTSPFTAPALTADGGYRFSVREVSPTADGTAASSDYVYDTTAQLTIGEPTSPGRTRTPTWTIAVEPGGSATCSFDGGGSVGCTTGFTGRIPGSGTDRDYVLTVTAVDALGNQTVRNSAYTYDTTAPVTPTVVGPSGDGNVAAVQWSWATRAGDTSSCQLLGPAPVGPVPCTSPYSRTLTTDGTYRLQVVVTDAAQNVGPVGSSLDYRFDRTAPAAPAFLSSPPGSGTDATPSWTFTTASSCQLVGTSQGPQPVFGCTTAATPTLPADDSWTLTVSSRDAAGNVSSTTSAAYVLDRTGPAAPTVSAPPSPDNDSAPRFTWMGEMPTTAECRLVRTDAVGTTTGAWTDCTVRLFTPTLTGDADYQVQARLTDPLGNLGAIGTSPTYSYDGTAPARPTVSGPPLISNDTTPTFSFTPEAGGSAQCSITGATGTVTASCSGGTFTPTLTADDSYVIEVVLTDAVGNASPAGNRSYQLDATGPAAATLTAPASPGRDIRPSWGISGDGNSTLICTMLAGGVPVSATSVCTNGYLADLSTQPDGTYVLEVVATDAAGNQTTVLSSYVLDTTAPSTPPITGPLSPGNALSPSWTFPVQAQTTAQCRLFQGLFPGAATDCSGGSFTVTGLADGTYRVEVVVTDLAGNTAPAASSASYVSDRTAPAEAVVVSPASPGNDTTPTWTWTGSESGLRATCRLDRDGAIGTPVRCDSGTFSPAVTGDATYVVTVRLIDLAGNRNTGTVTPGYLLDTSAPAQPVVTGPAGDGNDATPVWSWTAEAGARSECRLDQGAVLGTWATCTSGQTRTLSEDAVYVLHVRVVDAAGNPSAVTVTPAYTYDGTAPVAPVVTAPSSPSNALTPSFGFTGDGTATAQCRLLRSGALVRDWAACSSPTLVDLTGLPDASYVLEVRLTDQAGNTGPIGSALPYALDTTAPPAPVVSGPSGPSTVTAPTFTWPATEAGITAICQLVHDGVLSTTTTACSSPYAPTLVGDGQWALVVQLDDRAGNRSAAGQSGPYVLDTTPPPAPVVTAPTSPGRDTAPSWTVVAEPGTTTECRLSTGSGSVLADWAVCRPPVSTDLSGRPDGTYVLDVRATDEAGLLSPEGSGAYLLDTSAPDAPVFTAVPASPSRLRALSFGFTAEPRATVVCRLSQGATVVVPSAGCTSPWPVNLTGLPDGTYTLSAHVIDLAGNSGPTATTTHVLDSEAPAAPSLVSGPASVSPDRTPIWIFTSESGAGVLCRVTGAASGVAVSTAPCASPFAPDLTSRPDDTYTLTAWATDEAGNVGPAMSSSYQLDASAPLTAVVTPPPSPGRDLTPTWQVSTTEGTVQCKLLKGTTVVRDWVTCGPTFGVDLTGRGDGTYVLLARVVDTQGNLSAEVTSRYLLDTTAPSAAFLTSPASPASDRAPTWSIASDETGVTAQCQVLDPNDLVAATFAACEVSAAGAPYLLDLTGAADGTWTLVVRLVDGAGNVGPDTRGTYVLDTTPPNAVQVVGPPSPSPIDTPTWRFTGDSDAVLECRLSGGTFTNTTFSPCTATAGEGSFTANLTAEADGAFSLAVRSRDAAGNLGPETTSSYVIDRQAPAAPVVPGNPVVPSQQPVVNWEFVVEPDASALCTLSRAGIVLSTERACTAPYTTDLSQYGDGDYTLSVRAVDAAGNSSPAVVQRYTLDRLAPEPPLFTSSPAARSSATNPQWGFAAAEPGDLLECRLVATGALSTWAPCTSPATFDLGTDAVSGTVYRLELRATDLAGNISATQVSAPYELDRNAPLAPLVLAPDPVDGAGRLPQFTVALALDDTETVRVVCAATLSDGTPLPVNGCGVGPVVVDLTGLSGTLSTVTLAVHGSDAAGNNSSPASANYFFDAEPPSAPVVQTPVPAAALLADTSFSWEGPAEAVRYACELHQAGSAGPWPRQACNSGDVRTMPSLGSWTLQVWAYDKAGNESLQAGSASYSYLPPVPKPATPVGPRSGTDSSPTWTFATPGPGLTATCLLDLPGGGTLTETPCLSPYTLPADPDRPFGTYALAIRYTDAFGNVGPLSAKASYRYGPLTPPPVPVPGGELPPPAVPPTEPPSSPGAGPVRAPVLPVGPVVVPLVPDRVVPVPGLIAAAPAARGLQPGGQLEEPGTFNFPRPGLLQGGLEQAVKDTFVRTIRKPTVPLILLVVLAAFLLVQNRIDRRDPKLASAPVGAEPMLDFKPLGGGAPA